MTQRFEEGYQRNLPDGWKCWISLDGYMVVTDPSGREERIDLRDLPKKFVQARAAEREWREEAA